MNRSNRTYRDKRVLSACLLSVMLMVPSLAFVAAFAAGDVTRSASDPPQLSAARYNAQAAFNATPASSIVSPAALPAVTLTVNTLGDAADDFLNGVCDTDTGLPGNQCTLRAAIQEANSIAGDDTINFSLAPNSIITLLNPLDGINSNIAITGPGANLLTVRRNPVSGTPQFRLFEIFQNRTVTISGLTLSNADIAAIGGAIRNSGAVTLDAVTLSNNHALAGAGVFTFGETSSLTITNSTVSANLSDGGAAIYNQGGGMTITNTTVTGNSNQGTAPGAAIWIEGSTVIANVTNCTVTQNTGQAAAIFRNGSGVLNLRNTIAAGNTGGDTSGITNLGNNLIGGTPLVAPLANYGGPTSTMALLPGSPAIDAGTSTGAPATDQRGIGRVGAVDIGAFESRGFTISATSGTPQNTATGTAFGSPLVATVTSAFSEPVTGGVVTFVAPTSGASGTFTGGATTANVTIGANGVATAPTFTANGTGGSFNVTAGGNGITSSATFSLTSGKRPTTTVVTSSANPSEVNTLITFTVTVTSTSGTPTGTVQITQNGNQFGPPIALNSSGVASFTTNEAPFGNLFIKAEYSGDATFETSFGTMNQEISCSHVAVVTNSNDFGPGSMRGIITDACPGSTVTFDMSPSHVTSPITSQFGEIIIDKNLIIQGPGANLLTVQRGTAEGIPRFRFFSIASNVTVTISGLTLSNADTPENGGVINNRGALTLTGLTLSNNHTDAGGAAVFNTVDGTVTLSNSTLSGNKADIFAAFYNQGGPVSITNTTLTGNTNMSSFPGSAIFSESDSTTNVTNCTISGNTPGPAVFHNPGSGQVNLKNSIVVGNSGGTGGVTDQGNNLIGGTPLLAPLGNYGGPTQTMALLPGSPAINAGTSTGAPATDQRGISRAGAVDIGAFESRGFTIATTSGTPQQAPSGTAFGAPLVATVSSAFAEPVAGGLVTFTAPAAGPSGTFASTGTNTATVTVNGSGVATSSVFTANNLSGDYLVTAGANGASSASFSLSNLPAISINDVAILEGDSGTKTMDFTVTLSSQSSLPVEFAFSTANGTATTPSDYLGINGVTTFTAGQTTKTISITINGDETVEPDETFVVNLSAATNATITDSQGVGTILDDDAAGGVIKFSAANYTVAEGAGSKTITVERTGDTSQTVTVDYASSDHSNPPDFIPCTSPGAGFASSRCDFTTAIGTLRFAPGEASKTFNVLINQDNYTEGPETLELTLSNPTGGAVFGVPATAILSITDDATEPAANPIDTSSEFVRSQYHDFLNREPDGPGLAFWTDNIEKCNDPARRPAGQTAAVCIDKQRESTAIAFFMSPEFQMTGGFVYRLYKGSLTGAPNYDAGQPGASAGRFPTSLEFMKDVSQVSEGIVVNNQISGAVVEANRNRLAAEFVQRPEFVAKYGGLNNTLYVQELFNTTGIAATAGDKQTLVDGLGNGAETRASVLRKVVDGTVVVSEGNVQFTTTYGQAFYNQENRRVFVFMEYVGYLRRNPDTAGFVFWLGKLNQYNGDPFQAEMVRSFILSPEYRSRFGQP